MVSEPDDLLVTHLQVFNSFDFYHLYLIDKCSPATFILHKKSKFTIESKSNRG